MDTLLKLKADYKSKHGMDYVPPNASSSAPSPGATKKKISDQKESDKKSKKDDTIENPKEFASSLPGPAFSPSSFFHENLKCHFISGISLQALPKTVTGPLVAPKLLPGFSWTLAFTSTIAARFY